MKLTTLPLYLATIDLATGFPNKRENAQVVINSSPDEPQRLIEFGFSGTRWVTEAEKWVLRRFMDITDFQDLGTIREQATKKDKEVYRQKELTTHFKNLTKSNILRLFITVEDTGADKYGVKPAAFEHPWGQHSIIVTIPEKSNSTIVVGAHQDSVSHTDRMAGRAPGADDDGSGTMNILEVMRVVLSSSDILKGKAQNTIEFHWYPAEEGGALGSQAIFSEYEKTGRNVKAMFQQDMMGFITLTVEAGRKPEFGLMMDWMDEELMNYLKLIIQEYTDLTWVETGCGITCGSDHMSAIKAGYPAVFIIEAEFKYCDNHLHGTEDLIADLDFDHMVGHAQMTLAYVYELAFADL